MPGCVNLHSLCPEAASRTDSAWKSLDIVRSKLDFLPIYGWKTLEDLFRVAPWINISAISSAGMRVPRYTGVPRIGRPELVGDRKRMLTVMKCG